MVEEIKIPSVEEHYPREKCHPSSFRTDVFIKPAEDGKPAHKVRLIWCCPEGKWNEETKRCEDAIQLHKLIREEAPHSSELEEIKKEIEELKNKLDELCTGTGIGTRKGRKKYDCEAILKKDPCALDTKERKVYAICSGRAAAQRGESRAEAMRKAWEVIRRCKI